MKVTALEEYGLRCVLQLARQQGEAAASAEDIAHKEGMSGAYVQKILLKLCNAGIVRSVRGSHGGYRVARPAEQISMGEVIRALDGAFVTELCSNFPGNTDQCVHISSCGIRPAWLLIMQQVYAIMDRTTIADLLVQEAQVPERLGMKILPAVETVGSSS